MASQAGASVDEPKEFEFEEVEGKEELDGRLKEGCEKLKIDKNHHERMIGVKTFFQVIKEPKEDDDAKVDSLNSKARGAVTDNDVPIIKGLLKWPEKLKALEKAANRVVKITVEKEQPGKAADEKQKKRCSGTGYLIMRPQPPPAPQHVQPIPQEEAVKLMEELVKQRAQEDREFKLEPVRTPNPQRAQPISQAGQREILPSGDELGDQDELEDQAEKTDKSFPNFAVITNYHSLKKKDQDDLVGPDNVTVEFFYDSEEDFRKHGVTCRVSEISAVRSENVRRNLDGDRKANLDSLDFAVLSIKHPDGNPTARKRLEDLDPFILEETDRTQTMTVESTRFCIIGHPHGAYKQIAFGGLRTNPDRLWREGQPKQTDRNSSAAGDPNSSAAGDPNSSAAADINSQKKSSVHEVEHTVATCGGSSGSPVIQMDNESKCGIEFVPFHHYRGSLQYGDAISCQSISPEIRRILEGRNDM